MNENAIMPTYRDMISEIGKHISERKFLIFKRIVLILWPGTIVAIAFWLHDEGFITYTFQGVGIYEVLGALFIFFWIVYSFIATAIFEVEKRIWIDSYFDGRNLTPKDSWRISRKLLWPSIKLQLYIFVHYYLVPILICIVLIAWWLYIIVTTEGSTPFSWIVFFCVIIGYWAYNYYLKVHLRYYWFAFLDLYGHAYTYRQIKEEVEKLNEVSKGESFKKALIANIGIDSVEALTKIATGILTGVVSAVGAAGGRLLGGITKMYAEEYARQVASIAQIVSMYLLYRVSRQVTYGETQKVNDSIYSL